MEIEDKIIQALYHSIELLGGKSDILGTIGSWRDSLSDEDVLAGLQSWNEATLKEKIKEVEFLKTRVTV